MQARPQFSVVGLQPHGIEDDADGARNMRAGVPQPEGPRTDQRGGDRDMTMGRAMRAAMVTSGLVWVLASCQAIGNEEAQSTEQVLAAAGFI